MIIFNKRIWGPLRARPCVDGRPWVDGVLDLGVDLG